MKRIENCIRICERIENIIYTDIFYSISQINKIKTSDKSYYFDFYSKGLNEESEKRILAIVPKKVQITLNFPVKFFKILSSSKFKKLEHKDYLGTILSLGIKRETLGDLIVKNDECYGIIRRNMLSFLQENLKKVNHIPVKILEVNEAEIPKNEFQDMNINILSLRLDSFISSLTPLSRNSSVSYINEGNVMVNYEVNRDKSFKLKIGDIVSIRKYGKYKIIENEGLSKKSKLKMLVKKYI